MPINFGWRTSHEAGHHFTRHPPHRHRWPIPPSPPPLVCESVPMINLPGTRSFPS